MLIQNIEKIYNFIQIILKLCGSHHLFSQYPTLSTSSKFCDATLFLKNSQKGRPKLLSPPQNLTIQKKALSAPHYFNNSQNTALM